MKTKPRNKSELSEKTSQSASNTKKIYVVLIILLVLISAYLAWIDMARSRQQIKQQSAAKLSPSAIKPTENLDQRIKPIIKTYTSSDGVFSFDYPNNGDWTLNERSAPLGTGVEVFCNECLEDKVDLIMVTPVKSKSSEEYISQMSDVYTEYTEADFNGIEAVQLVSPGSEQAGGSFIEYFVINNGQGYLISLRYRNLLNKTKASDFPDSNTDVLSTFKFLK